MVELGPFIVPPLAPGDVVELCGAELLPDDVSQSFIALFSLLLLIPLLLPLVEPLLPAPGLFAAELLLPGGQSLLDRPRDVPEVAPALLPVVVPLPLVPALVPDLPPVVPVVLLVCAIAAVPRVSAMIETAVRRRRFIRCPPFEKRRLAGGTPWRQVTVNRGLRRHVPINPESGPAGARHAWRWRGIVGGCLGVRAKKKGRTEARPKFREEKPEGLAVRSGGTGSHCTIRIEARLSING